jgi:uncharacterized YigZ family protein
MTRYPIPAEQTQTEIEVKKSRFIATAGPVFSIEEARAFIKAVKVEFADASHNVPAFLVGYGSSITKHCNDDGEPSGTAGRPILAVLEGSGLGDIAVVVTRYWGGTKLGTGGLVRAYGDATKEVLSVIPKAEKVPTHTAMLVIPYTHLEQLRLLVTEHAGKIEDETFAADITLVIQFMIERFDGFQTALNELSHGTLAAEVVETHQDTIFPLHADA